MSYNEDQVDDDGLHILYVYVDLGDDPVREVEKKLQGCIN